jgi:type VI secretion system protein ImpA
MEVDLPPLIETLHQFDGVHQALSRLRKIWIDHAGFEQAVNLDKSVQLAGRIVALLNGIVAKRDPTAALADAGAAPAAAQESEDSGPAESAAPSVPMGQLTTRADVADALAAVVAYFSHAEPSSPALLLARQAQQLVGCSFVEAMRILMPAHIDQAVITVGGAQVFDLPLERLSALAPSEAEAPAATNGGGWGEPAAEAAAPAAEGAADGEGEAEAAPGRRLKAESRPQALALLDQVSVYYRAAEPTSPVPILVDRARRVAERDFMSLLKDFLPAEALKAATPDN